MRSPPLQLKTIAIDGNNCTLVVVLLGMRISKNFKTFMQRAQVMRFASVGKNGYPHVVPVSPIFHENKIGN